MKIEINVEKERHCRGQDASITPLKRGVTEF